MSHIEFIIILLFVSFKHGCLSWFLDFCFQEGNIFKNYRPWLAEKLLSDKVNEIKIPLKKGTEAYKEAWREAVIGKAFTHAFWYKPLGGCLPCFSVFLTWFTFPVVVTFFNLWGFGWWLPLIWIAYAVISNFFVRKF